MGQKYLLTLRVKAPPGAAIFFFYTYEEQKRMARDVLGTKCRLLCMQGASELLAAELSFACSLFTSR